MPACQRVPRGPKRSPSTGAVSGHASGSGIVGGGAASAVRVAGPATPSAFSADHSWKRCRAASIRGPKIPSKSPEGKPCSASRNCSDATSQPLLPSSRLRGTEPVAREAAERLARLRADDAVDRDVGLLLEAANRLRRARSGEPVDRALIKPMRAQADLKGGDARIGRRGAGGDGRGGEDQGQSKERPGTHGLTVFAVSAGNP